MASSPHKEDVPFFLANEGARGGAYRGLGLDGGVSLMLDWLGISWSWGEVWRWVRVGRWVVAMKHDSLPRYYCDRHFWQWGVWRYGVQYVAALNEEGYKVRTIAQRDKALHNREL